MLMNIYMQSRALNNHTTKGLGNKFIESDSTAVHWVANDVVAESIDSRGREGWVDVLAL